MDSVLEVTLFESHEPYFSVVVIERLVQNCRLILGPEICSGRLSFQMPLDLSQHLAVVR